MEGLQNIYQKLLALLEAQEVRSFESQGTAFTPDLHEAVALAKSDDVEQGTVVEDLRRGYLWRSELLRPAAGSGCRIACGRQQGSQDDDLHRLL